MRDSQSQCVKLYVVKDMNTRSTFRSKTGILAKDILQLKTRLRIEHLRLQK